MKSLLRLRRSEDHSCKPTPQNWEREANDEKKLNTSNKVDARKAQNDHQYNMRLKYHNNCLSDFEYKKVVNEYSTLFQPTLGHVLESEKYDRNEIKVLSLGIHQYLADVFHALDFNNQGFVQNEDLRIMCRIIGKAVEEPMEDSVCLDSQSSAVRCSNSECPVHLRYSQFTKTLVRLFGSQHSVDILDNRKNSKLIDAVVNINRRIESMKSISKLLVEVEDKLKSLTDGKGNYSCVDGACLDLNKNVHKFIVTSTNCKTYKENLEMQNIILLQIQELQCMREIIEDLRIALQTSDAENIGLRVKEERIRYNLCYCHKTLGKTEDFPDENDSIDRLIVNFPSDENLLQTKEWIRNLRSTETKVKDQFGDFTDPTLNELVNKCCEDSSFREDIMRLYHQLLDAKSRDTKLDLLWPTERLKKDKEVEVKPGARNDFERILANNAELKERLRQCEDDLSEARRDLRIQSNEAERMKQLLQRFKKTREMEVKNLRSTRQLMAEALLATRKAEARLLHLQKPKEGVAEGGISESLSHPARRRNRKDGDNKPRIHNQEEDAEPMNEPTAEGGYLVPASGNHPVGPTSETIQRENEGKISPDSLSGKSAGSFTPSTGDMNSLTEEGRLHSDCKEVINLGKSLAFTIGPGKGLNGHPLKGTKKEDNDIYHRKSRSIYPISNYHTSPNKDQGISRNVDEKSDPNQRGIISPSREANSLEIQDLQNLTKMVPRTSTQILESLEAEVELMRRILQEDQMWG